MRTRAYRYSGALRHPLRNGLTAWAALSLETNPFGASIAAGLMAQQIPGWIECAPPAAFDISHGCQDYTVLPLYASAPYVFCTPLVTPWVQLLLRL